MPKNKKLAVNSGIQTNQILTNDDEICIPRLSSILLAVCAKSLSIQWKMGGFEKWLVNVCCKKFTDFSYRED